jgi:acyl-CoA thioesterase-1
LKKLIQTINKLQSGKKVSIVVLGDSLSSGWMVGRGYVDVLRDWLQENYPDTTIQVFNQGVPGDIACGGMRRLHKDVFPFHPDCVLVQFGINDAFQGVSADVFQQRISSIIEQVKENNQAEILLVTSVYFCMYEQYNQQIAMFYSILNECARIYDISVANVHEYWKMKIQSGMDCFSLVQPDGVHPTEIGYQLMAEAIIPFFANT